MATYKVIQDIEAEDKLLGPLSLRQFLYAVIVFVCGFVVFRLIAVAWWLAIPFLPPMILFSVLAVPSIGGQQPSEIWLLAKIRYFILPRKKIWSQSGVKELVTITAPKIAEPLRTDGLNQTQVKSRLKALAATLDSRGWAVKNVTINTGNTNGQDWASSSDRLINPMGSEQAEVLDIHDSDDVLDDSSNSEVARKMDDLISGADKQRREFISQKMDAVKNDPVSSIANIPSATNNKTAQPNESEKKILEKAKVVASGKKLAYSNMKVINPKNSASKTTTPKQQPSTVTTSVSPDILHLSRNDDLNVATIARQISRNKNNEVVVSLH